MIRVYSNSFGIAIFKPEWIRQVIQSNKDKGHTNIAPFLILPSPKGEVTAEPAVLGNPQLFKSPHYVKKKQKTVVNQPLYITIDPKATGTSNDDILIVLNNNNYYYY